MADSWLRESGSIASNRQSPPEGGGPGWKEEVSRVMMRSISGSYQRYSSQGPNENSGGEKRREARGDFFSVHRLVDFVEAGGASQELRRTPCDFT